VAEPAMAALKATMFEEVKLDDALKILDSRRLGFSQVRLLPKGMSMRPIMNLRRRTLMKGSKKLLGPSINTILGPVGSMLKLEKTMNPHRLGSAMFSVGDIYKRIKEFKERLGSSRKPLFFAKVDVQGAFDSIPQQAVIDLMAKIPSKSEYKLVKHVEVKPSELAQTKVTKSKPLKKWQALAKMPDDRSTFKDVLEGQLAQSKRNTVFVESVASRSYQTRALMALMTTHIQDNLVKIGKKYYRQKNGIPQGSVLSSALCSYFYADLEQTQLSFLQVDDCLLLRLIDDFLLITVDQAKAARFVTVMHHGVPEYGVVVNPDKTLVNFDMSTSGKKTAKLEPGELFPYCGTLIDCTTLDITKNREPAKGAVVFDSLTVEYGRYPGQNFKRKVVNAFKIQSHLMFYDTVHNSQVSVLRNIYKAFVETASKTWAYARCLPKAKRPAAKLVIDVIKDLIGVAFLLLASESRTMRYPGYKCEVKKPQMAWLAMVAFRQVLRKKQAGYREVINLLDEEVKVLSTEKRVDLRVLLQVARDS
jgi:telomerase reverse transcriptase